MAGNNKICKDICMELPEELTNVTPFSKILALFLFILLPIIGFLLGTQYQARINTTETVTAQPTIIVVPTKKVPTNSPFLAETNQIKAEKCYKKFKEDYA